MQIALSRETHVALLFTGFMALGSHLTPEPWLPCLEKEGNGIKCGC